MSLLSSGSLACRIIHLDINDTRQNMICDWMNEPPVWGKLGGIEKGRGSEWMRESLEKDPDLNRW
jgi:hypothetical protein